MQHPIILHSGRQLHRHLGPKQLPPFIAITEGTHLLRPDLPPHTVVILRGYTLPDRAQRAAALAKLCRRKRWRLLIAGDPLLAVKHQAAGIHMPEGQAFQLKGWIRKKPHWLVTMAAHSKAALWRAARLKVNAALHSPVFATTSHPESTPLGVIRFNNAARHVPVAVYALGGINHKTIRRLKGSAAAGVAALGWKKQA